MDDDDSGDRNLPNAKILTSKTISEWCQLVAKEPKSPALCNLLNAFQDACQFGVHSDSPSIQRLQNTRVFHQIITFVLSESENIFCALLEVSDGLNKGKIMNLRNSKKWQAVDPLIKSYLRNSVGLLNQLTDNKILTFVLTRLRASAALFCAYPSLSTRLLKVLLSVASWMLLVASVSFGSFVLNEGVYV
jgi:nucleolar complex protein 2